MHPITQYYLAIGLAVVFAALAAACGFWASHSKAEADKLNSTSVGKISGRILDSTKPIYINIGGNNVRVSANDLKNGINIKEILQKTMFGGLTFNLPIKIYEENGRLLFDISIYNEKQEVVCTIVANEWMFNPDGKFDRNYGLNAFEIVDENFIPKLQIFLEDDNKIYIGGVIDLGKMLGVLTPSGTHTTNADKKISENDIKRLFKYPSSKNNGVLETKNIPEFKNPPNN